MGVEASGVPEWPCLESGPSGLDPGTFMTTPPSRFSCPSVPVRGHPAHPARLRAAQSWVEAA
jgi:hypothetical protein